MEDQNKEQLSELQERLVSSIEEFSAANPTITEALAVMNMTLPDYVQAMESIHGAQVFPASSYVALPINVNS
jgi:hypothetical protein